ncbi:SPOR domain-containing protein [Rhodohalobacter sp. SW132]|uniref:SPOR domain-containing protein n=1 Tax=Rhodohalobacter sp. SW132 TaxID=2293433 RepID=UPI00131492B9|nr:SPOR domain-containing protein [Rhodohalobacter sp. SW132]
MKTIFILLFLITLYGCGTTEPAAEEDERPESLYELTEEDEDYDPMLDETLSEEQRLLARTRSNLGQHYSESMQVIPEMYLGEIVTNERQRDPHVGFRVQLFTTTNVAAADSVRDHFVAWADTTIAGYEPDAYVIFRSPNYRVRAGDFQDRNQAIHFSNMLKPRYPDAWVVHERIEPSNVPADTADIRFVDLITVDPDVFEPYEDPEEENDN